MRIAVSLLLGLTDSKKCAFSKREEATGKKESARCLIFPLLPQVKADDCPPGKQISAELVVKAVEVTLE